MNINPPLPPVNRRDMVIQKTLHHLLRGKNWRTTCKNRENLAKKQYYMIHYTPYKLMKLIIAKLPLIERIKSVFFLQIYKLYTNLQMAASVVRKWRKCRNEIFDTSSTTCSPFANPSTVNQSRDM